MKIAITTSSFADQDSAPLDILKANFSEVILNPKGRALTLEETIEFLAGCSGVIAGTELYSDDLFSARPELKVISRCGAGMDSVDLKAAESHGVSVFNTPDGPSPAVAELTLALAFNLARKIAHHDRNLRAGIWKKQMGRLLTGQKVAIIGYGRIGRRVASLLAAVGCEIAVHDPYANATDSFPNQPLDKLLPWCDGLTLHCPLPKTGVLLTKEKLSSMKSGAWIINTARGGLVDEHALAEKLSEKHLSGAALDVFSQEPYKGPLADLENVILTPHIGSYARESRIGMEQEAAENLIKGLKKVIK